MLGSCANSPLGESLQESLQPDPQLQDNPPFGGESETTAEGEQITPPENFVQLPNDFPQEITIYPGSNLEDVTLATSDVQETSTVWKTTDPINVVQTYYQNKFQSDNWEIVETTDNDEEGVLVAKKEDLQVTINLQLDQVIGEETRFSIDYSRNGEAIVSEPEPTPPESPEAVEPKVGASSPTPEPETTPPPTTPATSDIPQELRQFAMDVAQLGIFEANFPNPNQTITRGEFARALVQANNKLYADIPAKQIRLGIASNQPVFTDVPPNNPYFSEIQGLAEAGLIPSSLSGESEAVQFRPDAPLTRQYLILWKVPLDIRQGLPQGTVDTVQQRWGFQDASKIETNALRAVLADFDNGDNANIRRVFGFTTLFQPQKPVTRAEAATALWYFGFQGDGRSAREILNVNLNQKPQSKTP